jgi:hypothetical protein
MIAATGGGCGDIVFAIPTLRALGCDKLYIKRSKYPDGSDMFTAMYRLMESQGFICLPTSGEYPHYVYEPGLHYDIDLDEAKKLPFRGENHICMSFAIQYKLLWSYRELSKPWIDLSQYKRPEGLPDYYATLVVTPRWREWSTHNWATTLREIKYPIYFIGSIEDWDYFCRLVPNNNCFFRQCRDFMDVALMIKYSVRHYCNQSCSMAIAQSLCHPYSGEFKLRKTNTMAFQPYEEVLNPNDQ